LQLGVSPIFPVGEHATRGAEEIMTRVPSGTFVVAPLEGLTERLKESLSGNRNLLLIKGSRRLGLEWLVDRLAS